MEAELGAFLREVPALTPGYGEAVRERQDALDKAREALASVPASGEGMSSEDVRRILAMWSRFREALEKREGGADGHEPGGVLEALKTDLDGYVRKTMLDAGVTILVSPGRGPVERRIEVSFT